MGRLDVKFVEVLSKVSTKGDVTSENATKSFIIVSRAVAFGHRQGGSANALVSHSSVNDGHKRDEVVDDLISGLFCGPLG